MSPKYKKLIISISIISIVLILGGIFYYINNVQVYNKTLADANNAVATEEYDKAITLYEEALNYKKDPDVNEKIDLAKLLIKSKEIYETAIKQTTDKKYLEAIESFKKVDKQDTKRYPVVQSKISECKNLYISDNLKSANDYLANNKFDEANKYLDNILKLDVNNADAKKVKDVIAKAIQKQKDDAAAIQAKVVAEAKAKTVASNQGITEQQAIQIVKQIFKHDTIYESEGIIKLNGLDFYNIHVYSIVSNPGEYSHTATTAWCAVQKNNGKVYNWVVDGDLTTPLN